MLPELRYSGPCPLAGQPVPCPPPSGAEPFPYTAHKNSGTNLPQTDLSCCGHNNTLIKVTSSFVGWLQYPLMEEMSATASVSLILQQRCSRNKPWNTIKSHNFEDFGIVPKLCAFIDRFRDIQNIILKTAAERNNADSTAKGEANSIRSPSLQWDLSWPFTLLSLSINLIFFFLSAAKQTAQPQNMQQHTSTCCKSHTGQAIPALEAGKDYL